MYRSLFFRHPACPSLMENFSPFLEKACPMNPMLPDGGDWISVA